MFLYGSVCFFLPLAASKSRIFLLKLYTKCIPVELQDDSHMATMLAMAEAAIGDKYIIKDLSIGKSITGLCKTSC